ncbi:hypothetical protein [Clostridium sporogenes]|uniref:hypothetical protein n=1 Tax=Clostridium sporogenes TaxID=1509 RepID=UPI00024BA8CF|nr:hypothetical protein [Clostridium sporogenes]EHN14515.1 hypothetical protein IYC_13604 [Clostridium sporogenes PA 3679]MBA4509799.1 hypothetical protein [Clostridium sporogenes]NFQ35619.1 hypothetical protein [Clostridium sporogenes]NFQ61616.1 hypothetical protein [Clostridium sporogenes]NFU11529.1 hypothetical protein [Clostridium sporogenes]
MSVTNIEELKAKKYIEVELPGWDVEDTFTVKLQRVNLLDLAAKGKIPNPLMGPVIDLFQGKGPGRKDEDSLKTVNELAELFCETTMVEPTFKEVQEVIGMTDEQKIIIYNFAVHGVQTLEPFRKKSKDDKSNDNGEDVS